MPSCRAGCGIWAGCDRIDGILRLVTTCQITLPQRVETTLRTLSAFLILMLTVLGGDAYGSAKGKSEMMLLEAVQEGDTARIRELLSSGAELETRDSSESTPLLIATRANHIEVARILINANADVNAKDNIDDTPFLYAGAEGRNEILKMILATGKANLEDTNRYGGTALIPAAHHGHPETVRILLGTAINIDHMNNLNWTALLEAVILGDGGPVYQSIVGLLLDAGADPKITDRDGITPLIHAKLRDFTEIVRLIEDSL